MFKNTIFSICFFIGFCSAAYVDTFPKCSSKDSDCLKDLYPTIIKKIAGTGIPELGIPVLEPLHVTDLTFSILGVLNITIIDGTVSGLSSCTFDVFTVDFEKGSGHQENTCSIIVEGLYELIPSPIITAVLGKDGVHGKGNLKVVIDQAHILFDFPVHIQKRDDGETYMKVEYENIKYDLDIKGGLEIAADNIYLGEEETSKTLIPLLNQNWKFMFKTFGRPIVGSAVGIYFDIVKKFFVEIPTSNYITDDLSTIAKS